MVLSIKDPEAERLARDLARLTGESITDATRKALQDRLRRVGGEVHRKVLLDELAAIRRRWSALPVVKELGVDAVPGHDDNGLPR